MVDVLNLKPKFRYKAYVKIKDGFYKDYKGTVLSFDEVEGVVVYVVKVKIDDNETELSFDEKELTGAYRMFR